MPDEATDLRGLAAVNERTRAVAAPSPGEPHGAAREAPLGPREAFLIAHEKLSLLAQVARAPAFAVVAVDADARVTGALLIHDRRALILGRHEQCGLRIEDSVVALRQVAVLVRFEGERPVIHVRDLGTAHPFVTEDGSPNAGVMADGPLYIAVGNVAVWFLPCPGPSLPASADEAFRALAPRSFIDRRAPGEGVRRATAPSLPPLDDKDDERPASVTNLPPPHDENTRVTSLAPPLLLGEGDDPEIAWGMLKLSRGPARVKRAVSAERLEQGILLGRYDRCSLVIQTPENTISRVHALLLRLGREVWILDTASTNGVKRGGVEVQADVLRDTDTLELGEEITLEWARIKHAEA
jgi:hypothetical protein